MRDVPEVARPDPTGPPDREHAEWEAHVARLLAVVPERLRPAIAWLTRRWVARLVGRTMTGISRVQIFDRSMTLAAQAFTSIFPIIILLGAMLGPTDSKRLVELAHIPQASRSVLEDAWSQTGFSAFGVVGTVVVLLSSTGLARALTRAYSAVWGVRQTPVGPVATWRWLVSVLTVAASLIGTRLLSYLTDALPLPNLWAAILPPISDLGVAVLLPWLLLGGAVPARMLAPGGLAFSAVMLVVRPVGSVYLPHALESSADRYGSIGVAFTYIGWLYVMSFCLLLTAVLGEVVAHDEGTLGRWLRKDTVRTEGSHSAPT